MSRKFVDKQLQEMWPRLWRFAVTLCRNRDFADDLAQMTCQRALENAKRFKPDSHFDRWVFTICRNIWYNELRARKVRRGNGLVSVDDTELPAPALNTETHIFAGEVLNKVLALPEAQRETLHLVYIEGYSYKEAAEMLDIPIGTVMSRLAAARKRMAAMNEEQQCG